MHNSNFIIKIEQLRDNSFQVLAEWVLTPFLRLRTLALNSLSDCI
jgi:hypothetical protein